MHSGKSRLQQNGLRPISELAADKPHGTRLKYMAGCKCLPCRSANSRYECERAAARRRGEYNGIVSADKAREHLRTLAAKGIGRRTVADIAGMSASAVQLISTGQRKGIRAMNEQKILAIDPTLALNGAQLIPAKRTWKRIKWLLSQGFTKREIARRLGYKMPALQFNKQVVTARNAMRIEKLYNAMQI